MAREWTERHIRELVRQEMKGIKTDGFQGLEPAWITPETSEEVYFPRVVVPIDTIKINGKTPFYDENTYAPFYYEDGTEIRSLEYIVNKPQLGPTQTYNGQNIMMAMPITIPMTSLYYHEIGSIPCDIYETNVIDGKPLYTPIRYRVTEDSSKGRYTIRRPVFNMYVLQNGKIYGLEAHGNITFRYLFDDNPTSLGTYLTLTDVQREMGKGWENIYSPISEYDWKTKEIYIAYSFTL